MSILRVFSIRDVKACSFGAPFFVPTVGVAVRAVVEAGKARDNNIGLYPADHELIEIGLFDSSKGVMTPLDAISHGFVNQLIESVDRQFVLDSEERN